MLAVTFYIGKKLCNTSSITGLCKFTPFRIRRILFLETRFWRLYKSSAGSLLVFPVAP